MSLQAYQRFLLFSYFYLGVAGRVLPGPLFPI